MSFLKKSILSAGLATAFLAASTANAASLEVDVDIKVPEMLVLYAYTDVDLTLDTGEFAALFDSNCTALDCAVDLSTTKTGAIAGGNVDLGISLGSGSTATITLQNSWGVRAIGSGPLAATVTDLATGDSSVSGHTISPTAPAVSATGTVGDVSFIVDFNNPDTDGDGFISTNYTIKVTGI